MNTMFSDPTAINIMTESDLSNIISNFDYEIILDIIENTINYRFNAMNSLSNLPSACESVFKEQIINLDECAPYLEQIKITRQNTFKTIIDVVSTKFGFSVYDDSNIDLYTASFCIYNLLISDFRNTIVNFYTNFIISEMSNIYENFGIARFKKQKDSTTLYNKRSYQDQQLGLIVANLNFVLENMKNFDIPYERVLHCIYKDDPETANYISQIFTCNVDFYKDLIVPSLNSIYRSIIITDIRCKIDSIGMINRCSILDIKSNDVDEE